jgi:hypothetical protein
MCQIKPLSHKCFLHLSNIEVLPLVKDPKNKVVLTSPNLRPVASFSQGVLHFSRRKLWLVPSILVLYLGFSDVGGSHFIIYIIILLSHRHPTGQKHTYIGMKSKIIIKRAEGQQFPFKIRILNT